jgi:hypothetical protein
VSEGWWTKGGAKIPGSTTLDRLAQSVRRAMHREHPDDARKGRVDLYRAIDGVENGRPWEAFVKSTWRVVSFRWKKPPPKLPPP